jgi:hypothetical protein
MYMYVHQTLAFDSSVRVGAMQKCSKMIILRYIVDYRLGVWAHCLETCNWYTPGVLDAFAGLSVDIRCHVASS